MISAKLDKNKIGIQSHLKLGVSEASCPPAADPDVVRATRGSILAVMVLAIMFIAISVTTEAKQSEKNPPQPAVSGTKIEEKKVNVVFRFDDYSARSSTNMELKIIDAFRKNNFSVTFAVIPFVSAGNTGEPSRQELVPLTAEKGDILKAGIKDSILDIALHGYSHQTISAVQLTEFLGLDYKSQVQRLTEGKKFLEGMINTPITIFVPPYNKYDLNTLRALEELRFSTLSAGINGDVRKKSKLYFLPASCKLPELRDAVKMAKFSSDAQPLIVVLFHAYDFKEINKERGSVTYQEFCDLLSWLKVQESVRILSIGQATKVIKDLSANRFLSNKRLYPLSKRLPHFLREESIGLYHESPEILTVLLKAGRFYLTIIGLAAVFSFIIGILIFSRSALIMKICVLGSIALSVIIPVYAFRNRQIGLKGMMISAGVIGIALGLGVCFLYTKKKRVPPYS